MNVKLLIAVTIFATAPFGAFAQKDAPADHAPRPTLADAQRVVQTISNQCMLSRDMEKLLMALIHKCQAKTESGLRVRRAIHYRHRHAG